MSGFAYDFGMALVPGTVAGYYSALLMAKFSKFNALKHEALRVVRSIDYIGDEQSTQVLGFDRAQDLPLIASELLSLKHVRAGTTVSSVGKELLGAIASCKSSVYSVMAFEGHISDWQSRLRAIRPSWRFFLPWGQI